MAEDDGVDWTGVTEEMARHIASQGETLLQSQAQMALAADQRAVTVAGIFAAIATALIAASLAYWDKTGSVPILVGGLCGGLVMLAGGGICLWSARQIDFYYPGNEPANWYSLRRDSLVTAIGGEAENYQHHITKNAEAMEANGCAFAWGAAIAFAAPVVAFAAWLLTICLSSPV